MYRLKVYIFAGVCFNDFHTFILCTWTCIYHGVSVDVRGQLVEPLLSLCRVDSRTKPASSDKAASASNFGTTLQPNRTLWGVMGGFIIVLYLPPTHDAK